MKRYFTLFLVCLICVSGCDSPTLPVTTPGGGFFMTTWGWNQTLPGPPPPFPAPGVTLKGTWHSDCPTTGGVGALGNPATWTQTSTSLGPGGLAAILIVNGRTCANWDISWNAPLPFTQCLGLTGQIFVPAGNAYSQTEPVACVLIPAPNGGPPVVISGGGGDGGPEGFYFTPYPIYNGVATGTVTATGSGLSAKYGMPLFQYYNSQGNLVAQVNASSISSDGTHAYGPVPAGISSVPAGIYFGVISNANSSGGYTVIGSGGATVAAGTPPPIRRATITISGSERSKYFAAGCSTRWDGGYLAIYVNGNELASVPYGDSPNNSCTAPSPMPTASGLATQLANLINGNIESPVDASVSGSTITLSTNARAFNSPSYSFTTQIVSYFVQAGFPPASFTMPASGNLQ